MRPGSRRNREQGIIVVLVAVVMLFVIGAMAALSIDVVTLYTARSEAQLAADAAALAAARVLANSGTTSDTSGASIGGAQALASAVAIQVAQQNLVGGAQPTVLPPVYGGPIGNPTVTITVQVTNLPTFFARIWGRNTIAVSASATAEAYNPSGAGALGTAPVAPACVKPWLLPNIDPSNITNPGSPIFDPTAGTIKTTTLLGWSSSNPGGVPMSLACPGGNCSGVPLPAPAAAGWQYYPGDPSSFPAPTNALPDCVPPLNTAYEESIAGCIQTPISCNSQANIDLTNYFRRNRETERAVNCLAHTRTGEGDQVDFANGQNPPFQFLAGNDNPIAGLAGNNVMVSDSLVTVPVFDVGQPASPGPPPTFTPPTNPVQIIGFVQLFLSPLGTATTNSGQVQTAVINLAGCGTGAVATPIILGNGASPVAVRLISP